MTNEEIFNENIKIAYKNVQHYKNCGIEYEDLEQICLTGLWKAVLTYEREKGFALSTYAYKIIQNEVNHYLRKNHKYFKNKSFSETVYENIKIEDILIDTNNEIDKIESHIDNANCIKKIKNSNIKEKEKQVLNLFLKGYTQKKIAQIVKCSQPQVSRIIKKFRRYICNN